MRCRLTLAVVAAFVGGSSIAAHAQAPVAVTRGGTVAGSGIANGARTGNATGGAGATRAGTGGLQDNATFGRSTGGITGSGRGSSAGTGGTGNQGNFGANTGGIKE
ncbi:MAG TPA: hypothetical protein VN890_08570 [Methylocella sp.]|nr:hypothetical protein [Methylocella sp.]